jgi:GH24 family phage-related lysozyme (muramidase)
MIRVPATLSPALSLSDDLPLLDITTTSYCSSAKGIFDSSQPYPSGPVDMEAAFAKYEEVCENQPLALFFHGGLVSKQRGIDSARQLIGPYSSRDAEGGNAYPYFFIWESGLLETLWQNIPQIASDIIFQRILAIVAPKVTAAVGGQSNVGAATALFFQSSALSAPNYVPAASVSQADIEAVQQAVATDPLIRAEKARIARSATAASPALSLRPTRTAAEALKSSTQTLLSPDIVMAIVGEQAQEDASHPTAALGIGFPSPIDIGILALKAGSVLINVVRRFANGRAHGLHNTIVEEIFRQFYISNVGFDIWKEMKDATAAAFGPDPQSCVGTKLVQQLVKLFDDGKRPRVVLIGHSAGAVYIANFLAAADSVLQSKSYGTDIAFDVILMAAAARTDVFAQTLSKYANRIKNLRWFSMTDELENQDILLAQQDQPQGSVVNVIAAQIYTSSLLYFISGCLEDPDDDTPLVGMDRYYSGVAPYTPAAFPAVGAVGAYLRGANREVFSDTTNLSPQPPPGMRCSAHHHGGFPTDPQTLQSTCWLLHNGFAPSAGATMAVAARTFALSLAPSTDPGFVQQCIVRLKINEGYETHVYRDSVGVPTVGIGFNLQRSDAPRLLQSVGANYQAVLSGQADLTEEQIDTLFKSDLSGAISQAQQGVSNYGALVQPRQFVIVDMIFNMGSGAKGFGGFVNTIADIESDNFTQASNNMTLSRWYSQVGDRAKRDVSMMRSGTWVDPAGTG